MSPDTATQPEEEIEEEAEVVKAAAEERLATGTFTKRWRVLAGAVAYDGGCEDRRAGGVGRVALWEGSGWGFRWRRRLKI